MNRQLRFTVGELLILTAAIAILAAEASSVGLSPIAFALLAALAVIVAHIRWLQSPIALLIVVLPLVSILLWQLQPEVQ
jgi:hypothetical protein